jgi:hypothetical protein
LLTRSAVRVGLRADGEIPFVGAVTDEVDPDGAADQLGRLRVFLHRKHLRTAIAVSLHSGRTEGFDLVVHHAADGDLRELDRLLGVDVARLPTCSPSRACVRAAS